MSERETDRVVRLFLAVDLAPPRPQRSSIRLETTRHAEQADVWVVGDAPAVGRPPERVAVLRVTGTPGPVAGPAADHHVSREAFATDAESPVLRALDERLARRPRREDDLASWVGAVRRVTGADRAAFVGGGPPVTSGEVPRADELATGAPWTATGPRAAERVPGADAVTTTPARWQNRAGVLVIAVDRGGSAWLDQAERELRCIAAGAAASALERRVATLDAQLGLVRSMLSVTVHDLRGAMFGFELGMRLLARIPEAEQLRGNLQGSVTTPLTQVRQALSTVRELLEVPADDGGRPSTVRVDQVWSRELAALSKEHPARVHALVAEPAPAVTVAAGADAVARVLRALIDNALAHGGPETPVEVRWSATAGGPRVEIRNAGSLPFEDLARIKPFEHRAGGRAGLGLWAARLVAASNGIELQVRQEGGDVVATATFPAAGEDGNAESPAGPE